VTAIEAILPHINESVGLKTVDKIDQFQQREATEALVRIAFFNPWLNVREKAIDLLSKRNRYDYLPELIGQLVSPISTRYWIAPGSNRDVHYQYSVFQQTMDANLIWLFDRSLLQAPRSASRSTQRSMFENAALRAREAERQIEFRNEMIEANNLQIQHVLARTTGVMNCDTPADWWNWWYELNEVYAPERPVYYSQVQEVEVARAIPSTIPKGECLIAGTLISTERGLKPVESLEIGDRVLCKDLVTRVLEYRNVLQPTERPPTPTFKIQLEGETIQASGGHLFWVEGRGWTKVRDMSPGMSFSTANGATVQIQEIEPSERVHLFNLVVDRNSNYFVGEHKILSHDSSILARGEPSVEEVIGGSIIQ
jgi:hypothetical protein